MPYFLSLRLYALFRNNGSATAPTRFVFRRPGKKSCPPCPVRSKLMKPFENAQSAYVFILPSRCNVVFDILVFVVQALFRRHRNIKEVQAELRSCNVQLCASEIDYLALAHRQATPRIRQKMEMAGGYILHLDATHETDAPALMSGMDSLSQFVLANVKIPSEN